MMPAWGEVKRDTFQLSDTIFHGDEVQWMREISTHLFVYTSLCAFFFFLLFMFWKR